MSSTDPLRVLLYRTANPYHITPFSQKAPPLGLMTMAAYLRENSNFELQLLDGAEGDGLDVLKQALESFRPHVFGLSALTANCYDGMVVASMVREVCPDSLIVAGGVHYAAVPEESLRVCTDFDMVATGEGEATFLDLCQTVQAVGGRRTTWRDDLREVAGLVFLEGHGPAIDERGLAITDRPVHYTPARKLLSDLSVLPLPAYDLHSPKRYNMKPWSWSDMSLIESSRGCPYKCSFCHNSQFWEYRWRARPVDAVVDEAEYLSKTLGHNNLYFVDDSFQTSRKRIIELCEEVLRRNLKLHMWAQCRVDELYRDRDLFPLMKRAGFYGLLIGFESPRQNDLDRWQKMTGVERALELAPDLTRYFQCIMGTFMVGDLETKMGDFEATRVFAEQLGVDIMLLMPFTPVPNSIPLWQEYKGIPDLDVAWDYDLAGMYRGGVSTRELSRETVLNNTAIQLARFFFNPKHMAHAAGSGFHARRHYYHMLLSGVIDVFTTEARMKWRPNDPRRLPKMREHYKQSHIRYAIATHTQEQEAFAAAR